MTDTVGAPVDPVLDSTVELEDDEADRAGRAIIEFLGLRMTRDGRVCTAWHTKTPQGVARSITRILQDAKKGEVKICQS